MLHALCRFTAARRCAFPAQACTSHFTRPRLRRYSQQNDYDEDDIFSPPPKPTPLPPTPAKPPIPAPLITQSDLKRYLIPMYEHQWGLHHSPSRNNSQADKDEAGLPVRRVTPQLAKKFLFSGYEHAVQFAVDVSELARREGHLPVMTLEPKAVYFYARSTPAITEPETTGITLHDIRLALEVERHFLSAYLAHGWGVDHPPGFLRPWEDRPVSLKWVGMIRRALQGSVDIPGKPKVSVRQPCVICNGWHRAKDCPERYTKAPPVSVPCAFCGGAHWRVNCPEKQTRDENGRPRIPCKACGKMHWRNECPVLREGEGVLKKGKPPLLDIPITEKTVKAPMRNPIPSLHTIAE